MKIFFFTIFFFIFSNTNAADIKLEKIIENLNKPWSLSFIDNQNLVLTEKNGKLFTFNLKNKNLKEIQHNLSLISLGQGGLLDVLYHNNDVYVSYSENRGNWKTSTSVAKGTFNKKIIRFENIFKAEPPIESGYHFGSR